MVSRFSPTELKVLANLFIDALSPPIDEIVFVTCRERIGEARDELMRMLAEDELREAVLLIFANKQDLPNAMNAAEITDKLGLHSLRNRNWYIQVSLYLYTIH